VVQDLTTLAGALSPSTKSESQKPSGSGKDVLKLEPTEIEIQDNVVIAPQCSIGRCVIEPHAFLGNKAVVSDGCTIERFGVLAGGAVLAKGSVVPMGQVWAGNPAKYLRDVTAEEKLTMIENANQLLELAKIYAEETSKDQREVLNDKLDFLRYRRVRPTSRLAHRLWERGYPLIREDRYFLKKRVMTRYTTPFTRPTDRRVNPFKKKGEKDWEPLSYDFDQLSDVLKRYGVNTDMYEAAYQRFKHEPPNIERPQAPAFHPPHDRSPWEKKYDDSRRDLPTHA
jgi:carbonic anhydrase/acetyltransferase-like protein (isoleucine patch superfamily)